MHFPTLRSASSALLILVLPKIANAYAQCYYPDGSVAKDYTFVECYTPSSDPDALSRHAPCCIPSEGDICQPNGLCWWPYGKTLYRGACTDSTWQDAACQSMSICANSKPRNATWIYVQKCEGDEWQCGALDGVSHSLAGCNKKDEEFEDMIQTRSTTMSAPTTFTKAASSTSGATNTPAETTSAAVNGADEVEGSAQAPSTSKSGGLSKEAIASIAVGGWAVFTLLASIAWWCGRPGKHQGSSSAPNRTHGWDDDPWNQNRSGFGNGMVEDGSAPSYPQHGVAASTGDTYQPDSGFGALTDPTKNESQHETIQELGSEVGHNTLVPIGLAYAAKNDKSGGSPPYASPVSCVGSPLPRYQSPPPAELPSAQSVAEMNGSGRSWTS